ncbi:cytochrome b5, partial [Calocera cornea HHB12733]
VSRYGRWKVEQAKKEAAALERKKRREAKLSSGTPLAPEDLDEPEESLLWALTKIFLFLLLFTAIAGRFITGSVLWGYEGKWARWRTYWPAGERVFSEAELARYDGSDPALPIYLGLDGLVFDVSASRRIYGPGGSYSHFAGVDAARAFSTGCFALHRTHDLRGLGPQELASIEHWKEFFTNSDKYFKVGRVVHPPIEEGTPVPPGCDAQGNALPQDVAKEKEKERSRGKEL